MPKMPIMEANLAKLKWERRSKTRGLLLWICLARDHHLRWMLPSCRSVTGSIRAVIAQALDSIPVETKATSTDHNQPLRREKLTARKSELIHSTQGYASYCSRTPNKTKRIRSCCSKRSDRQLMEGISVERTRITNPRVATHLVWPFRHRIAGWTIRIRSIAPPVEARTTRQLLMTTSTGWSRFPTTATTAAWRFKVIFSRT